MADQFQIEEFTLTGDRFSVSRNLFIDKWANSSTEFIKEILVVIEDASKLLNRFNSVIGSLDHTNTLNVIFAFDQMTKMIGTLSSEEPFHPDEIKSTLSVLNYHVNNLSKLWFIVSDFISEVQLKDEFEKFKAELTSLRLKSQFDAEEINELKKTLRSEYDFLNKEYKPVLERLALEGERHKFEDSIPGLKRLSIAWLAGIVLILIAFIFVLYMIFNDFCFESQCFNVPNLQGFNLICKDCGKSVLYLEIFKSVAYRVLIISLLGAILAFCIKNYNAAMHNLIVIRHKSNSLSAALLLINRAVTDSGKDNLLAQASNAIFSHQPTGYNKKEPTNFVSGISNSIVDKFTSSVK